MHTKYFTKTVLNQALKKYIFINLKFKDPEKRFAWKQEEGRRVELASEEAGVWGQDPGGLRPFSQGWQTFPQRKVQKTNGQAWGCFCVITHTVVCFAC